MIVIQILLWKSGYINLNKQIDPILLYRQALASYKLNIEYVHQYMI
jgi:hypothetical protein